MSVWAIAMVKDEHDVIEQVLRHVAGQGVDGIIVADNQSTDGTAKIVLNTLDDLACETLMIQDTDPAYWQSRKMTRLANLAAEQGATWVWPFDADELWYYGEQSGEPLASLIPRMLAQNPECDAIQSRLWHHFPTAVDDPDDLTPFERMRYRQADEAPIGKVIVRWREGAVIEAGNHAVTMPGGAQTIPSDIQIRHFPYRSVDQFVSKAINGSRGYRATDLPWGTGQHWREYGVVYERGGRAALEAVYWRHFFYDLPSAAGLVYDPARIDS